MPWNGVKAVQLNMEAVSKLKETDEVRLAFFSMDFKVLYRRLMHAGVERTLRVAD
jgi:primosomal replication protein N